VDVPPLPPSLLEIKRHLPAADAWLVGGAVRDLLLGRPLKDLDLAVPRGGLHTARQLADALGAAFVPLDPERGVARVVWQRDGERLEVDVADFRAPDLERDLLARDLTVNAMALSVSEPARLLDPSGGRGDLERGVARLLSPAVLDDDPLRTLRAVRLAAQLGFRLDGTSAEWIAACAGQLGRVAGERVRDELWKCLAAPAPAATLRLLDRLGLLAVVVPEIGEARGAAQSAPHRHDVWEHTLAVVERVAAVIALVERLAREAAPPERDGAPGDGGEPMPSDLPAALAPFAGRLARRLATPLAADRAARGHLLLAALFHDLGKPPTRSVGHDGRIHFYGHARVGAQLAEARLAALRFAADEVQWVARVVRHHMRPLQLKGGAPLSRRAIHRYHRAAGNVAPEVCLHSIGDNLAKGGIRTGSEWPLFLPRVVELLDAFFNRHDELVAPPRLLSGDEVMALGGRPAGPWVGEALRDLTEAQAVGRVDTRERAERFVRRWARAHGEAEAEPGSRAGSS
jgi:putative nucleotidyltransferase with HDIG domain